MSARNSATIALGERRTMVIVLMGAAGAGKTTVGRLLSDQLHWEFLDGDVLHSPENIAKMAGGNPLTDEDRRPWLEALRKTISQWSEHQASAILACSLLTRIHRTTVLSGFEVDVKLVFLQASRALLEARLTVRTGHFAGVALLDNQLALLDETAQALRLDASQTPEQLVRAIRKTFHL